MSMSIRSPKRFLALAGALAAAAWLAGDAVARQSRPPDHWRFTLPAGDPARGEGVFVKLHCGSCHNVAGQRTQPGQEAPETAGPDLTGALAQTPAEYLAERLITPDRFLPHGLFHATYSRSDGSSRMINYNEELKVSELIDLVAYLRSIGGR